MLRLPPPLSQDVARAVFSVEATRCIVVPILDLVYSERAVELACRLGQHQGAYIVEVPWVLALDTPLSREVEERAALALAEARQIMALHRLRGISMVVPAREVAGGIRRMVRASRGGSGRAGGSRDPAGHPDDLHVRRPGPPAPTPVRGGHRRPSHLTAPGREQ
jgi:hypothetical protein